MPDHRDLSGYFNTQLPPEREQLFQQWAAQNNRLGDLYDYDMRGAWARGFTGDERGHFPDTFKKPNHPTFSNESMYNGVDGFVGGRWVMPQAAVEGQPVPQAQFHPGPANTHWRNPQDLQRYFQEREPDVMLVLPQPVQRTR